jgi:hypothetical protein
MSAEPGERRVRTTEQPQLHDRWERAGMGALGAQLIDVPKELPTQA